MLRVSLLAMLLVLVAGCNAGSTDPVAESLPQTTVATTTVDVATTIVQATTTSVAAPEAPPATETTVPESLEGFDLANITLDGEELLVAVADDRTERQQGLMEVEDLLSLDGMLFVFEQDTTSSFWMKNTLISLDIAFFAADGSLVDGFTMEPCLASPCPHYRPDGSYRYALEMAAGTMPDGVQHLDLGG